MTYFENMRLGARLGLAFATLICLLTLVAVIGVLNINAVNRNVEVILHDLYSKIELAQTVENEVNKQSRALRTALLTNDPVVARAELEKIELSMPKVAKAVERLEATIHSAEGKAALKTATDSRLVFKEHEHRVVEMIKAGRVEDGRAYVLKELLPPQNAYIAAIEGLLNTQVKSMEHFGYQSKEIARTANIEMISLAIVACVLSLTIGFFLTRSITLPMSEAVRVARTVASGDLTSLISVTRRDEAGQLLEALSAMNESLGKIVGQVRASSESIATGSSQIAKGNADLSERTEEQASNLQQTAASMEEITVTVNRSSETARSATELAALASKVASEGGAVVAQVVSTMAGITESSKRIADITGVIDGIAFQTNILALNAAVEAARAGEQGRGFAVVAGEVRSLAQRAAQAAKEIKVLIDESVDRVQVGAELVATAGGTIGHVVGHTERVAQLIAEMSIATNEQTVGIGQVNDAVTQLDQVTQQNAALVEESAAAADSLSSQAERLAEVVRGFKLTAA